MGIKYIVSCLERNIKALISEDLAMDFSIFILVQLKIEGYMYGEIQLKLETTLDKYQIIKIQTMTYSHFKILFYD